MLYHVIIRADSEPSLDIVEYWRAFCLVSGLVQQPATWYTPGFEPLQNDGSYWEAMITYDPAPPSRCGHAHRDGQLRRCVLHLW